MSAKVFWGTLLLWLLTLNENCFAAVPLVADSQPRAAIVVDARAGEFTRLASKELQDYLGKLSGVRLPVVSGEQAALGPPGEALIVLGTAEQNPIVRELAGSALAGL